MSGRMIAGIVLKPGFAGSDEAPLAGDQLVAVARRAKENRLKRPLARGSNRRAP